MNITHIKHLFRAYFIENKKRVLIGSIICFAALAWGFSTYSGPEISPVVPFGFLIVIAAASFQSSLKKNNTTHFFNLPVTAAEKLVNAIAVIIVFCIIIYITSLAGSYTGYYIFNPLFHPNGAHPRFMQILGNRSILEWSLGDIRLYLYFAAALSAFLFGSIYFKKNALWITAASGLGFLMGIAIYQLVLLYIAFGNFRDFFVENPSEKFINLNFNFLGEYYFIPIILILFFISLTYLRLRETEV